MSDRGGQIAMGKLRGRKGREAEAEVRRASSTKPSSKNSKYANHWKNRSDFASIDPAPPLEKNQSIEELEKTLLNPSLPLFLRYRAMFSLRDLASPPDLPTAVPAVLALAKGFHDSSALFRHEIGFLFGQLSHPASIPALTACVHNLEELAMVRHESLEVYLPYPVAYDPQPR